MWEVIHSIDAAGYVGKAADKGSVLLSKALRSMIPLQSIIYFLCVLRFLRILLIKDILVSRWCTPPCPPTGKRSLLTRGGGGSVDKPNIFRLWRIEK